MRGGMKQEDLCWDNVVVGGHRYNEYPVSDTVVASILQLRDKTSSSVNLFHNETPTRELLAKLKLLKN